MHGKERKEGRQNETLRWLKGFGTTQIFRGCQRRLKYDPLLGHHAREAHTSPSSPIIA